MATRQTKTVVVLALHLDERAAPTPSARLMQTAKVRSLATMGNAVSTARPKKALDLRVRTMSAMMNGTCVCNGLYGPFLVFSFDFFDFFLHLLLLLTLTLIFYTLSWHPILDATAMSTPPCRRHRYWCIITTIVGKSILIENKDSKNGFYWCGIRIQFIVTLFVHVDDTADGGIPPPASRTKGDVGLHFHAFLYLSVSYISVEFMLTCAIYDDLYSKKRVTGPKEEFTKANGKGPKKVMCWMEDRDGGGW